MNRQTCIVGIALATLTFTTGFAAAVRVKGTSVSLDPPKSFSVTEEFPGFGRPDVGASIMVTEIPGPVSEVQKGMTTEGLATQGMTLLESRTEKVGGKDSLLLKVSQASGIEFEKLILVVGRIGTAD